MGLVHAWAEAHRAESSTCYADLSMRPVEAQFENGLLKPVKPLALRPGERVGVIVLRRPDPSRWDLQRLAHGDVEDATLAAAGLSEWADALDSEDRG
jgi:predicted DNA-binding antitoxin AbrB/MazE fold protein